MDAHQIDPEVAHRAGLVPRDAAHQRRRDGDAERRRPEVMAGQTDHLREVTHRVLAGVACQLVLVVKLAAVLKARSGVIARLVGQAVDDAVEGQVVLEAQDARR